MPLHASLVVVLLALGCAVGEGGDSGDYGFGGTSPPSSSGASSGDEGGDTGESSSSESGAAEDGPASSSEDGASTFGPADESGGMTTADPSGGDPGGGQPGSGMYSACLDPAMCPGLDACVQVVDAQMQPIDGFCTMLGCATAAVDCDPSPGGTATPSCFPLQTPNGADSACALDCSGGKSCPTGMQCRSLPGGQLCI